MVSMAGSKSRIFDEIVTERRKLGEIYINCMDLNLSFSCYKTLSAAS